MVSHLTTQLLVEEEVPEAPLCATPSREESAREVMAADSLTAMRRVVEEEEASLEDTTQLPAERLALATLSKEESVREVMDAVTITVRRVQVILPPATIVAVTGLVACALPSRRVSANAVRLAVSRTRRPSPLEITHHTKNPIYESSIKFPCLRNSSLCIHASRRKG